MEPLATNDDLTGFPGAPFEETILTAAGEWARSEAGWHIAPEITDTVTVRAHGGQWLAVPTLRLGEVQRIQRLDREEHTDIAGCVPLTDGTIFRYAGWPPVGLLSVTMTHGYETCPPELLRELAQRCQSSAVNSMVSQEQANNEMVSYVDAIQAGRGVPRALRNYRLPQLP